MKRRAFLPMFLAAMLLLSGCSSTDTVSNSAAESQSDAGTTLSEETAQAEESEDTVVDTSDMFTDRDVEIGYDEETCVQIVLSDSQITCDSEDVEISGSTATITAEGTYVLSGTLSDGMIIVNASDSDKIQLVLNGVDITSGTSAAIYIAEADKVFITPTSGTENTQANGGSYEAIDDNNIDAVIFSKSDLTLNGAGTLTINASAGHGIVSKDDLVLTSGTYVIDAASHGLSGKDSVRIANGNYTITAGKDGIHSENADDAQKGFVYISGGTLNITSDGDGISASGELIVEGGTYTIEAGGGSENGGSGTSGWNAGYGQFSQEDDSTSSKGLKSESNLTINAGTLTLDTADDAIHSNSDVTITGGTFEIATGDDGIHADDAVTISDGSILITESYEGIEGLSIDNIGGEIDLTSSDEGMSATADIWICLPRRRAQISRYPAAS